MCVILQCQQVYSTDLEETEVGRAALLSKSLRSAYSKDRKVRLLIKYMDSIMLVVGIPYSQLLDFPLLYSSFVKAGNDSCCIRVQVKLLAIVHHSLREYRLCWFYFGRE